MRVGFLAHHESEFEHPKSFLSKKDAERLVGEMLAERISAKLIRAFGPDSPFRHLSPGMHAFEVRLDPGIFAAPVRLPAREVQNCYFVPPPSDIRPRLSTLKAGWDWSQEKSA
jgi:hypothetical protein